MTERTCRDCDRPLQEEDDQYCPHCRAKRAGEIRDKVKTVGTIVAGAAAAVGLVAKIVGELKRKS